MVDSGAIRNYIILKVVEQLGIPYREKKTLFISYDFRRTNTI